LSLTGLARRTASEASEEDVLADRVGHPGWIPPGATACPCFFLPLLAALNCRKCLRRAISCSRVRRRGRCWPQESFRKAPARRVAPGLAQFRAGTPGHAGYNARRSDRGSVPRSHFAREKGTARLTSHPPLTLGQVPQRSRKHDTTKSLREISCRFNGSRGCVAAEHGSFRGFVLS
jgi:hypothetical protein